MDVYTTSISDHGYKKSCSGETFLAHRQTNRKSRRMRRCWWVSVFYCLQLCHRLQCSSAFLVLGHHRRQQASFSTQLLGIRGFRAWFESEFPHAITTLDNSVAQSQVFDHVLVDLNQLLHVCVRKSRSDGHALVLLMKELDTLVELATPRISLVLAMDGPPPAAKLATQRRRRTAVLKRMEWRNKYMDKITWWNKSLKAKKRRTALSEARTLCITPGTEFMQRAHQALLYWAWQRLSSTWSMLARNKVHIYISPSTVHGEGEVKLLEWIYDHPRKRQQESIAIFGGDSDLVLEGCMIPLTITHNVFVLLPEGNTHTLVVSLWETTRSLMSRLPNHNMVHLRTDLVILLILNGNDYLSKLRGSSGFDKLFQTYIALQKKSPGNLVDPDSLELQLPFCIAFFSELDKSVPGLADRLLQENNATAAFIMWPSLTRLYTCISAGYLPEPVQFLTIADRNETRSEADNLVHGNDIVDGNDHGTDQEATSGPTARSGTIYVQLCLGKSGSDNFHVFETQQQGQQGFKKAKEELASMALKSLFDFEDDEVEDGEEDDKSMEADFGISEYQGLADANVDDYLYGILWNLQSYQDGICADYSYNYAKRHAPTAAEIVEYLKLALSNGENIGVKTLNQKPFSPALSAGATCLAALPSLVKNELVPEPYRSIPNDVADQLFSACFDPIDSKFDANRFQTLCNEQISALPVTSESGLLSNPNDSNHRKGRRILMNDHSWTVISKEDDELAHPFEPPTPFSERLASLRPNNRMKVRHFPQLEMPRPRLCWDDVVVPSVKKGLIRKENRAINHSDVPPFMRDFDSVQHVKYLKSYGTKTEKRAPV